MAHGVLTTQVAHKLLPEFGQRGFDVLHDHGQKGIDPEGALGELTSWFGSASTNETGLAGLDLAVVSRETDKVYALIEIEETTSTPKVILGDIFATLLGNGITFQGKRDLHLGSWTTLIVLAHHTRPSHGSRMAYLEEQANQLKTQLSTPNSSIGRIVLDTFQDEFELEDKLRQHIEEALKKS